MVSQITPYIGATLTAKSFVIAIIGGLDNPFGVIVGGLFIGIVESLTALYIGPTYSDVVSFGLLVLVLIVRPSGLLAGPHERSAPRRRTRRRRWRRESRRRCRRRRDAAHRPDLALGRRARGHRRGAGRAAVVRLAVLIQFGINALLLATLAQAWNIIGGYTGYASFGNSVFFGLGTYGDGIAMAQFDQPFWVGLLLGAVLGRARSRSRSACRCCACTGHYFAIATLGAARRR